MPPESFEVKLEKAKAKELALARLKHTAYPSVLGNPRAISEPLKHPQGYVDILPENKSSKPSEEQVNSPASIKAEPTDEDEKMDDWHTMKPGQSGKAINYLSLTSASKRKRNGPVSTTTTTKTSTQKPTTKIEKDLEPSKRPFAPIKKPVRRPSSYDIVMPIETRSTLHGSKWYQEIDMKQKYSRTDLGNLQYSSALIRQCVEHYEDDLEPSFARLRQRLHQMEFWDFLSGVLIKKSKLLEDQGLPMIFEDTSDVKFPFDIKADALSLHQRWLAGRLDPHLLVGIDTKLKKNSNGKEIKTRNLQRDYPGKVSCNYVGSGNLQNGQWWPLQICAMRDGAHGEIEAGIHGQPQNGAYSIVLSNGGYADIDNGETLKYCGTSGVGGKPTSGTQNLIKSAELDNPVRVLRSSNLSIANPYQPSKGFRYDGLYNVVDYKILDEDTAMYQFSLVRRPDQDPIRFQGVEQRPTNEELLEYTKIRNLLGLST